MLHFYTSQACKATSYTHSNLHCSPLLACTRAVHHTLITTGCSCSDRDRSSTHSILTPWGCLIEGIDSTPPPRLPRQRSASMLFIHWHPVGHWAYTPTHAQRSSRSRRAIILQLDTRQDSPHATCSLFQPGPFCIWISWQWILLSVYLTMNMFKKPSNTL